MQRGADASTANYTNHGEIPNQGQLGGHPRQERRQGCTPQHSRALAGRIARASQLDFHKFLLVSNKLELRRLNWPNTNGPKRIAFGPAWSLASCATSPSLLKALPLL